jgi:hypothetical protein
MLPLPPDDHFSHCTETYSFDTDATDYDSCTMQINRTPRTAIAAESSAIQHGYRA